jgi:hypothetical protein
MKDKQVPPSVGEFAVAQLYAGQKTMEPFPADSKPEPGWDAGYESGYNDACAQLAALKQPSAGVDEREANSAYEDWKITMQPYGFGGADAFRAGAEWQARAQLAAPAGVPDGWRVDRGYSPNGYVLHSPSGSMIRVCDSGMGGIETAFAMFLKALLSAAPSPATESDVVPVPRDRLKKIHRDLDACQKVIWSGLRGADPAYCEDAQECLAAIEDLLNGGRS